MNSNAPADNQVKGAEMTDPAYNILFLCIGNSARSIIGEAIIRADKSGRFNGDSAGSHPVWTCQPMTAHWGVPNPAAATGTEAEIRQAFADTYRMLNARISVFTSLPFASIDRMALQHKITDIAKS